MSKLIHRCSPDKIGGQDNEYIQSVKQSQSNQHCYECNRLIPRGTGFMYTRPAWDIELSDYTQCMKCGSEMQRQNKELGPNEFVEFGELGTWTNQ